MKPKEKKQSSGEELQAVHVKLPVKAYRKLKLLSVCEHKTMAEIIEDLIESGIRDRGGSREIGDRAAAILAEKN